MNNSIIYHRRFSFTIIKLCTLIYIVLPNVINKTNIQQYYVHYQFKYKQVKFKKKLTEITSNLFCTQQINNGMTTNKISIN